MSLGNIVKLLPFYVAALYIALILPIAQSAQESLDQVVDYSGQIQQTMLDASTQKKFERPVKSQNDKQQ